VYADFVKAKISRLEGVDSAEFGKSGELVVTLRGQNRTLREHVLDIGKRAMLPVRVFYKMPDGTCFGESLEDYYTPIHVPGFVGDRVQAPPEEVASEKDGALKLKRIRSKKRGRPVLGWKYGDKEIRRGTKVTFKAPASLQWTMGRTMNVKKGANATVVDLATNRPIVYVAMGNYDGVELPVHAIGHVFEISATAEEPKTKQESKMIDATLGYLSPEMKRLVHAIGFGRDSGADEVPGNSPHSRDKEEEEIEPAEDMVMEPERKGTKPVDPRFDKAPSKPAKERVILFGRK
jgi:hypothetical protein